MSIYNPQRRLALSFAVAAGFAVVYAVYRAATSPLLDVERAKLQSPQSTQPESLSPEVLGDAEKWFVAHPWVSHAGKHFRDNGRYLFCEELNLSKDKRSIVVSPVAMLWRSKTDEVPVTLVADSAELFGADEFSLDDTGLGRIEGGLISGNVQVRGPQNLRISGGIFHLENAPMRLWSSEQVDFRWDRHDGVAHSGVQIQFDTSGDGTNGLADLRKVQLLGRVLCNFLLSGTQPGDSPTRMRVNAARGFVFDNGIAMKTGTFSGRGENLPTSQRLVPQDEVWVRRIADDGSKDELICPELRLTFRNGTDPETGEPVKDSMQLEHLQAWGRMVEVHSQQQDIHIYGNDIQYFVDQRQLDIRHTTNDVSDEQKYVTVQRGASVLKVPHIRLLHTVNNELQRLECNGKGGLLAVREDETPDENGESTPSRFVARWGNSLLLQASPNGMEQYMTLNGGGSVMEATQNTGLAARQITMTLQTAERIAVAQEQTSNTELPGIELFEGMTPKLLTASGGVVIRSAEGNGTLRNSLTVRFELEKESNQPIMTVSDTKEVNGTAADSDEATKRDSDLSFVSDTGDATVSLAKVAKGSMPAYQVWLKGAVEVTRQSEKEAGNFTATGNQLFASNSEAKNVTIQLFGDPAKVESATRNLEGQRIDLNELDGKADVFGSGRVRFITTKGIDGKELKKPADLYIYWSNHMTFQQRSATFVGKVRVVMNDDETQDVELQCAGLTVEFSRDISLDASDEGTFEAVVKSSEVEAEEEENPIKRLVCHNRVTVTIDQYEFGSPIGHHYAEFADLDINISTGDFSALGPGYLQSVSPDREGRLQGSSPITVRPNTPSQTRDTGFVYLRTDFVGGVQGNMDRRVATLSQNVVALMTPVRRLDERLSLQETPTAELPERAGILQAETLTVGAIWGQSDKPESFSLVGRTNARLNSRAISASADVITYDHAKEQFIIRAEGDNTVTVNHRSGPGGRFNRTSGTRFEYYRQSNQLKADQINGLKLTD